jgi:hypothetical protein
MAISAVHTFRNLRFMALFSRKEFRSGLTFLVHDVSRKVVDIPAVQEQVTVHRVAQRRHVARCITTSIQLTGFDSGVDLSLL